MSLNVINIIISVFIESFLLIYYCNSSMECKVSKTRSEIIIAIGYLIYCVLCLLKIMIVNICGFALITLLVILAGYKITVRLAIFKSLILTALMMFGELIGSFIVDTEISNNFITNITFIEGVVFSLLSKLLYSLFIVILRQITAAKNGEYTTKEMTYLLLLPISTCLFFFLFNDIRFTLADEIRFLFIIFGIMLIFSNFIVYIVCEKIIVSNIQIQKLKQIEHKREIDEKSYQLVKNNFEDMKIMIHDFNKYCSHIEAMLDNDREDVKTFINSIRRKNKALMLTDYTNNKALNLLLSQKLRECSDLSINFQFNIRSTDLSFISESDTISIFANLIDNAIESCNISENKDIILNIYTINNSFVVISINNGADFEPDVYNGRLRTRKTDKDSHGIGMLSIKKALSAYDGEMKWSYDSDNKLFNVSILINLEKYNKKDDRSCRKSTEVVKAIDSEKEPVYNNT